MLDQAQTAPLKDLTGSESGGLAFLGVVLALAVRISYSTVWQLTVDPRFPPVTFLYVSVIAVAK